MRTAKGRVHSELSLNGGRQSILVYNFATGRLVMMEVAVSDDSSNNYPTSNSNLFTWNYLDGSDLKSSLAYPIEAAKKYSDFFCGDLIYYAAWEIR